MKLRLIASLMVLASTSSLAAGRNVPGILVAPEPSPGLVLLLPTPGAAPSSDPQRVTNRALASKAVTEILQAQKSVTLVKSAKIYVTGGAGTSIDELDSKRIGNWVSGCSVEAAADLPLAESAPAIDYYVVQLACPSESNPNRKTFAAVGLTKNVVTSVVFNVLLTPVWSERG